MSLNDLFLSDLFAVVEALKQTKYLFRLVMQAGDAVVVYRSRQLVVQKLFFVGLFVIIR